MGPLCPLVLRWLSHLKLLKFRRLPAMKSSGKFRRLEAMKSSACRSRSPTERKTIAISDDDDDKKTMVQPYKDKDTCKGKTANDKDKAQTPIACENETHENCEGLGPSCHLTFVGNLAAWRAYVAERMRLRDAAEAAEGAAKRQRIRDASSSSDTQQLELDDESQFCHY